MYERVRCLPVVCIMLLVTSVSSFRCARSSSGAVTTLTQSTYRIDKFRILVQKKDDIVERRKKRRGRSAEDNQSEGVASVGQERVVQPNSDGSSSLEDLFGLGTDQLRELMEQELPVPREDVSTGKVVKESDADKNKVFKLPDLGEFVRGGDRTSSALAFKSDDDSEERIDRSNQAEYMRVLQLNPFADADESKFNEEYDIMSSIFGTGKLLNIPIPYLQQGHGMLLVISLIAALVYAPGNPLTEFPPEIRAFLKQGLINVYVINFALAVRAYFMAKSKNLPALFWVIKTFLLGGLPFFELSQARDPTTFDAKAAASAKKRANRNR